MNGAREKEDKVEARTGVAAAGGKIVAAGDTPGRPGRADNRTSLEGGTTITQKRSLPSPLMGCEREDLKQRDQGRLRIERAWMWRRTIRRPNRSEEREGRQD